MTSTPQIVGTFADSVTGSPLDFSVTISSYTNRVLGVFVSTRGTDAGDTVVSSVVLDPGGSAIDLTQVFTQYSGDSTYVSRSSVWYLLNSDMPSPGSYTLRVTAVDPGYTIATAVLLRAAKQEAPFAQAGTGTIVSDNEISTDIDTNPVGKALLIDVDAGGGSDATGTEGEGQTKISDLYRGFLNHMVSHKSAVSAGIYSMSWSFSNNFNFQAHSVVAFAPITNRSTWFGGGF